ncbi:MAG: hypothetical protein ACKPKO_40565, partial [Candidatus Fonsibacter sp.]
NPYRDEIINELCVGAFGTEEPTDEDIADANKRVVLNIFRKNTAGRAKLAATLQDVARGLAETHAENMLPAEVLSRVRATSMGPPKGKPRSPSRPNLFVERSSSCTSGQIG